MTSSFCRVQSRHTSAKGFSLLEVAIILLFVSLAMVPIIASISGPGGKYGTGQAMRAGSATRIIGSKHKEVTLANALMERLLAGDNTVLNTPLDATGTCTQGTIPAVNSGSTQTFNCTNNQYGERIYYQWIVTDRSREFPGNQNSGTNTMGNDFLRATLNIYNADTWDNGGRNTPILTMPTMAFRNTQSPDEPSNVTGILIVLDTSGSMLGSNSPANIFSKLPYRYVDAGYTPPNGIELDITDNKQLDIVGVSSTDDATTAYDDRYPLNGLLNVAGVKKITNCGDSTDPVFKRSDSETKVYSHWKAICTRLTTPSFEVDDHLSRLEAARSSLLRFLLTIEDDPTLYKNIQLGLVVFNDNTQLQIPSAINGALESPVNGKYVNVRRRLTWLNRTGKSSLEYDNGSTGTWDGVYQGARILYNAKQANLNGRVIFLVTDGVPTASYCNNGDDTPTLNQSKDNGTCMREKSISTSIGTVPGLGNSLAQGTFPGANGRPISVYGLGLMENEALIRAVVEQGFTVPTHGDFQYTNSVGEMNSVFENMKYAILKEIIQSNAGRYGIEYN